MPKKPVLRSCVICREKREKKDLIRIVRLPNGEVEIDLTGKKPGRGAYICRDEKCINNARKNKRLDNALKATVAAEIYDKALEYGNNEQ